MGAHTAPGEIAGARVKTDKEDVKRPLKFAKYSLMKLGIETDITRFVRKNVPRRLAPREEVLARMMELGLHRLAVVSIDKREIAPPRHAGKADGDGEAFPEEESNHLE
jgi:hypothetical protein